MKKRRKKEKLGKREVTIALAQIKYFDEHSHHNTDKIKRYIRLAKKKHADIVCFPESCVHKNDVVHFKHELIDEIKKECKKNSIWCIINDDMKIKGRVYNTAILISREGKIAGHYRKINLYGDDEWVRAGRKPRVFKTDFGKIGIAICWDLAYPKLFKKMKKKGAEIIFCPSRWAYEYRAHDKAHKEREIKILKSLVTTRAFENIYYVALCNPVIKEAKDQISYSAIADPNRIIKYIEDKEGMIVSKINLNEIKRMEKLYQVERF